MNLWKRRHNDVEAAFSLGLQNHRICECVHHRKVRRRTRRSCRFEAWVAASRRGSGSAPEALGEIAEDGSDLFRGFSLFFSFGDGRVFV
jgi:hypothetical protein